MRLQAHVANGRHFPYHAEAFGIVFVLGGAIREMLGNFYAVLERSGGNDDIFGKGKNFICLVDILRHILGFEFLPDQRLSGNDD